MPYNRKTTGMPNVDRVVNDIYSILDRFKPAVVVGGESGGITDHRDLNNLNSENYYHLTEVEYNSFLDILDIGEDVSWDDITDKPSNISALAGLSVTDGNFIVGNGSTFVGRKLQNSDLPAIAITDTFVVNSQAAMLALSTAERGDVAVRTDLNKSFILKGDDYSKLEDWQELLTPTDTVLSVDGRTGVVSLSDKYQPLDTDLTTIAGLTHSNRHVMVSNGSSWTRRALEEDDLPSLSISKITNLQDNLDGKTSLNHTHTSLRVPDTRDDATTTSDYPAALKVNFKQNSTIGLSEGGTYSTVLGVFGWNDASGGTAHELAFSSNGIWSRRGIPGDDWGSFHRILTTADNPSAIGAATAAHSHTASHLPSNIVYTDNAQTISGVKTFSSNTNFGNTVTLAGTNKWITSNTATTDKNSSIALGYPNAANSGYIAVYENNNAARQGDVVIRAGGVTGKIVLNGDTYNNGNTAFGKETFVGGYKVEVEGNTLVNGTLKANDFGDDWVDYSSSIQFSGFNETGLTKKVYYKKVGKRITIVFYFDGTCNGYYFSLNHTTIGNIKSEHMLAFKSLYTGILHYNGYINGFASTIVESLDGEIRIRAITSDGNRFPDFSNGQSLTIRGSFTYYTD